MRRLVVILVSISVLLAGFYLSAEYYSRPLATSRPPMASDLVGSFRPDFKLDSNKGVLVSAADFSGKPLLINFWATWCAPCREEMPMLMDLQREYGSAGLQVVGIALDDAQSASDFAATYGISYPILVGDVDVYETSAAYGNTEGVLPYSVLVDSNGVVRWQYAGKVQHQQIAGLLSDLD
jgi:thiol-disulfide isomerase/thioredoxin